MRPGQFSPDDVRVRSDNTPEGALSGAAILRQAQALRDSHGTMILNQAPSILTIFICKLDESHFFQKLLALHCQHLNFCKKLVVLAVVSQRCACAVEPVPPLMDLRRLFRSEMRQMRKYCRFCRRYCCFHNYILPSGTLPYFGLKS